MVNENINFEALTSQTRWVFHINRALIDFVRSIDNGNPNKKYVADQSEQPLEYFVNALKALLWHELLDS